MPGHSANVQVEPRLDFMLHAYNSLLSGQIYNMPDEVRAAMVFQMMDDLCTAARTMCRDDREEFVKQVIDRIRRPN